MGNSVTMEVFNSALTSNTLPGCLRKPQSRTKHCGWQTQHKMLLQRSFYSAPARLEKESRSVKGAGVLLSTGHEIRSSGKAGARRWLSVRGASFQSPALCPGNPSCCSSRAQTGLTGLMLITLDCHRTAFPWREEKASLHRHTGRAETPFQQRNG